MEVCEMDRDLKRLSAKKAGQLMSTKDHSPYDSTVCALGGEEPGSLHIWAACSPSVTSTTLMICFDGHLAAGRAKH